MSRSFSATLSLVRTLSRGNLHFKCLHNVADKHPNLDFLCSWCFHLSGRFQKNTLWPSMPACLGDLATSLTGYPQHYNPVRTKTRQQLFSTSRSLSFQIEFKTLCNRQRDFSYPEIITNVSRNWEIRKVDRQMANCWNSSLWPLTKKWKHTR